MLLQLTIKLLRIQLALWISAIRFRSSLSRPGGDVFKNGEGSTVLTARVYQAGEEIDTEGAGTYTWSKYDKDGQKVTSFNKTGKTLSVGNADVDVKGTFVCVVVI